MSQHMTSASPDYAQPTARRAPRIWPGVVLVILTWMAVKLSGIIAPGSLAQFLGTIHARAVGAMLVLIWWLAASRLPWRDRVLGLNAFLAGGVIAYLLADPSLRGFPMLVLPPPWVATAWVVWIVATRQLNTSIRRIGLVIVLLVSWGFFTLVRLDGLKGDLSATLSWRWSPTSEQRFMASKTAVKPSTAPVVTSSGDWGEFRGPLRDSRVIGTRIRTDWNEHPPKQLWRHRIGPAWSSFAVVGDRIYTQEQRNAAEAVVCYREQTGEEIWSHEDRARFAELISGPGPRATPTYFDGRLYAFGAKGILNCLDPIDGRAIWSRDATTESGARVPEWGFSSSPLVAYGQVSVITGGKGKAVVAYDAATGKPAWSAGDGWSYCSTQLSKIAGTEQILYVTRGGIASLDPLSGQMLWQHHFPVGNGNRVTQPAVIGDNDVIFGAFFGVGTRRLHIARDAGVWNVREVWTSRAIKPYYNDGVIDQGHLYGFDGGILTCINLEDGKSRWRNSSYGNGQVLLLEDQHLLLVLSERGEAALVEAKPDGHHQIASFQAIEGKTWNHPVIAHGNLFVRNGEEAACYEVGQ